MRSKVISNKDMVKEVLKASRKPLMAKRIAYEIYHKYDGYRLSRFMVRDILWKQLRKEIIYDNVNYTYTLKKSDQEAISEYSYDTNVANIKDHLKIEDNTNLAGQHEYKEILKKLQSIDGDSLYHAFRLFIRKKYLNVNTGNLKIDQLIASVVKDNKITKNEEVFLRQKTIEYGLSYNLIEKAKIMLNSNNPYLDNILHLIFEDGKVKKEELLFLKEKKRENNFSKSFLNQRFWQIGICYYLKDLNKIENFNKVIKLWHIGNIVGFDLINIDNWILIKLNIHNYNNIEDIIINGVKAIERDLNDFIKRKYSFYIENILDEFYKIIDSNYQIKSSNDFPEKSDVCYKRTNKKDNQNILRLLEQEKIRIGSPDVNLLVENIKFRIENELWD